MPGYRRMTSERGERRPDSAADNDEESSCVTLTMNQTQAVYPVESTIRFIAILSVVTVLSPIWRQISACVERAPYSLVWSTDCYCPSLFSADADMRMLLWEYIFRLSCRPLISQRGKSHLHDYS